MSTFSSDNILDRLKTALSISSDQELCKALGVAKSTISNWRKRNTIDFKLLFTLCEQINLDWLITGRGSFEIKPINDIDPSSYPEMIDRIISQAEEIGRLKERNSQLEKENNDLKLQLSQNISSKSNQLEPLSMQQV